MKQKTIEDIWYEKFELLNKLYRETKWLINSNKPKKQLNAIYKSKFDKFVLSLYDQDKRIRDLFP